jgi:tetratricopeptide (TPR) repeat protein
MPLTFVRGKLDLLRKTDEKSVRQILQARLLDLTEHHPAWAEAWLELGFIHLDEGLLDPALTCFERAMRGKALSDRSSKRISPHALAAANHGRLLAAMGRYQDACDSFSECLAFDHEQKIVAIEYANALRQIGQVDLALTYYAEGMFYQEARWNLPSFPRDADQLSFSHLARPKSVDESIWASAAGGPSRGSLQTAKQ